MSSVIDASVLIAFLNDADAHHEEARAVLLANSPLIVHPITMAEALVVPTKSNRAAEAHTRLLSLGIRIDDIEIDPMELARIRGETGCKMPDCCVLASALRYRLPILTFDERLRRAHEGLV